jgi:glyoxylase-like metal-dependent hydrolase (beta-lactamase superfamily II)
MLTEIADGVWTHTSEFMLTNSVVVQGADGVLVVDAGITRNELACLASDLQALGRPVVAGFSTHPHWDHVLWHPALGTPPRYSTTAGAAAIGGRLADPEWKSFVASMIPADLVERVPLDETFGRITALPSDESLGAAVRIIEHSGHAPGHAALLVEDVVIGDVVIGDVLIAGDMLSDVLVPILSPFGADPVADSLAALDLLEGAAARVVIPGHGTVGTDVQARIDLDRAYLVALRDGTPVSDPRIDAAQPGWEWVSGLHAGQAERFGR